MRALIVEDNLPEAEAIRKRRFWVLVSVTN